MSEHRNQYLEIADILSRHGMGYLVGVLGLGRRVPFHRGLLGHERRDEPYTRSEHVRLALEELGAAFVKLCQILSTRSVLLPPAYQVELAKLQDAAPSVPGAASRGVIAQDLGDAPRPGVRDFRRRADRGRLDRAGARRHATRRHPGGGQCPTTRRGRALAPTWPGSPAAARASRSRSRSDLEQARDLGKAREPKLPTVVRVIASLRRRRGSDGTADV